MPHSLNPSPPSRIYIDTQTRIHMIILSASLKAPSLTKDTHTRIHRGHICIHYLVSIRQGPLSRLNGCRTLFLLSLSALQVRLTTLKFSLPVCMQRYAYVCIYESYICVALCVYLYMHLDLLQMYIHAPTLLVISFDL
jgi:hypothetical protein